MKNKFSSLVLFAGLIFASPGFGQLPNGSIAPDFTLTDINGTSHTLYDYLNAGKTVYIDFFACHCPFCWNYHNTHALSDLYNTHGPGTASNDVFVIAIELDANNGTNQFYGISGNTQGNWVSGTNYPQINPEGASRNTIISDYAVNYYPLIYAICPDRTITAIGTKNTSQLYAHAASCPTSLGINEKEQPPFWVNQSESAITIHSNMDLSKSNTSVSMTDILGKQLLKKSFSENSEQIGTEGISKGIYFIRITSGTQILFSQKIQLL